MKIIYQRNFIVKEISEEEFSNIYSFYPISDFIYIPYIKKEYRCDEMMNQRAKCNEEIIKGILSSINEEDYYGTKKYEEELYSDFYESDECFVDVLFRFDENQSSYIEGILYTLRTEDSIKLNS